MPPLSLFMGGESRGLGDEIAENPLLSLVRFLVGGGGGGGSTRCEDMTAYLSLFCRCLLCSDA